MRTSCIYRISNLALSHVAGLLCDLQRSGFDQVAKEITIGYITNLFCDFKSKIINNNGY